MELSKFIHKIFRILRIQGGMVVSIDSFAIVGICQGR